MISHNFFRFIKKAKSKNAILYKSDIVHSNSSIFEGKQKRGVQVPLATLQIVNEKCLSKFHTKIQYFQSKKDIFNCEMSFLSKMHSQNGVFLTRSFWLCRCGRDDRI